MTGLAGVALVLGQAERAALLLGAVEAAREAMGLGQIHNVQHAKRITAQTRAALDAAACKRAWSVGRMVPLEDAVAEALAIADEVLTGVKG